MAIFVDQIHELYYDWCCAHTRYSSALPEIALFAILEIPTPAVFYPRTDDSHCNGIRSSLFASHCFENGYVRNQPVAWNEYWAEFLWKAFQERRVHHITEIMLVLTYFHQLHTVFYLHSNGISNIADEMDLNEIKSLYSSSAVSRFKINGNNIYLKTFSGKKNIETPSNINQSINQSINQCIVVEIACKPIFIRKEIVYG